MFEPETGIRATETTSSANVDELDELFNYDVDLNDPFRDDYQPPAIPENPRRETNTKNRRNDLGIDDEIEVTRKRRVPRVKLDENLLLSPAGIPKLRSKAKLLEFKGKGHEYSDISNLLNFYQLWLDDLFPKAQFLDALAMVEKQGHKKQMSVMRTSWIGESSTGSSTMREDSTIDPNDPFQENLDRTMPTNELGEDGSMENEYTGILAKDDLFEATPDPARAQLPGPLSGTITVLENSCSVSSEIPGAVTTIDDDIPEDELDVLMADEMDIPQNTSVNNQTSVSVSRNKKFSFDDEEEAMAEMDLEW